MIEPNDKMIDTSIENIPPYQVMPDLTEQEYQALKADIAARGVKIPAEVDEQGNVLDGHHRIRACKELGIECPAIVREGMTEEQKVIHAYKLNTVRRHLTPEQSLELVAEALHRFPNKSDRELASITSLSRTTISKYRKQLERMGQVAKVATREGKDGKRYKVNQKWECCICKRHFDASYEYMRNAWPLSLTGGCCADCDESLVTPAQISIGLVREKEGEEAATELERELLETDNGTAFTLYGDGKRDYKLPRTMAVLDAISEHDATALVYDAWPTIIVHAMLDQAQKADTLEAWQIVRDTCNELSEVYSEIFDVLDSEFPETAI